MWSGIAFTVAAVVCTVLWVALNVNCLEAVAVMAISGRLHRQSRAGTAGS